LHLFHDFFFFCYDYTPRLSRPVTLPIAIDSSRNGQTKPINSHTETFFPPHKAALTDNMFYPSSAGTVTSFAAAPAYPVSRSYYPAAPMSAVLPGQHYYPTMHSSSHMAYPATAAPMMYQRPAYNYGSSYYGHQPTVILSSPSRRHRHSRSRGGFMGYL